MIGHIFVLLTTLLGSKSKIGDVLTSFYVTRDFLKKFSVMRDLIEKFSVMRDWYPTFATLLVVNDVNGNLRRNRSFITDEIIFGTVKRLRFSCRFTQIPSKRLKKTQERR